MAENLVLKIMEFLKKHQNKDMNKIKCFAMSKNVEDNNKKTEIFEEYKNGKFEILVTTNMMARGIDIRTVCLVINTYLPRMKLGMESNEDMCLDAITLYHRIARVGRFRDKGVVLNIYRGDDFFKIPDGKVKEALYNSFFEKYKMISEF